MIAPYSKRPGWFHLDMSVAEPLFGLPGTKLVDGKFLAHRTHLPILKDGDAARYLKPPVQLSSTWDRRNEWAASLGFTPRVTQHQAVDFMLARDASLLADDMRLGKTLSALMCHDEDRGPLFVVAPLNARAVWLGWMRRLWPEAFENDEVGVMTSKTFDRATLDKPFVFGHYDIIHKWMIAGKKIGTLIADEAHAVTNPDARRSKALLMLSANAKRRIATTGTPIWKYSPNLWSLLQFLYPGAWGNYYEFCQRYGDPEATGHGTKYNGASNQDELNARLSEVMLRRRWVDVADDLPPITRSVVVADLTTAERNKLDIIAAEIKLDRKNTAANLAAYRRQVATITMADTIAQADRIAGPVVVWAWHKDFAAKIAKKFGDRPTWVVHGDIAVNKRDEILDEWRKSTNGVLVATMSTFQQAIDLSHSDSCVYGEIYEVPGVIAQSEMRTYDPKRPMNVTFIVANHWVHQRIVRLLISKLSAADSLGVATATDAIDALRDAMFGPEEVGDLDRLLEDFIASAS